MTTSAFGQNVADLPNDQNATRTQPPRQGLSDGGVADEAADLCAVLRRGPHGADLGGTGRGSRTVDRGPTRTRNESCGDERVEMISLDIEWMASSASEASCSIQYTDVYSIAMYKLFFPGAYSVMYL